MRPWYWSLPQGIFIFLGLGVLPCLGAKGTESISAADFHLTDAPFCAQITTVNLLGEEALSFAFSIRDLITGPGRIIGQCLSASQKAKALQRVHQVLIEHGYLTTTVELVPDTKETGVLECLVHPGRLGALQSETLTPRGLRLAFPGQSGDVFNLRAIEQGLENVSQVPKRSVSIQIVPGAEVGQSDLQVLATTHAPWQALLGLEYAQGASLGRLSGQAQFAFGDLLGLNEHCEVNAQQSLSGDWSADHAQGPFFQQVQGQCTLPIGYSSLSVSSQRESLVQQRVLPGGVAFRYRTQSMPQTLALSHTLVRNQVRKVMANGRWLFQHRQSWIDDTPLPIQHHRGHAQEVALTVQEHSGQALLESTLTARWRTPRPIANPSSAPLLRWEGQLSRPLALLTRHGQYRIEMHGQTIRTAVLPEDQWMLGSRQNIRGFNETTLLAGEQGYRLRQEWSTSLKAWHAGFIAYDWGQVASRRSTSHPTGRPTPPSPTAPIASFYPRTLLADALGTRPRGTGTAGTPIGFIPD